MVNAIFPTVAMLIKIAALLVMLTTKSNKNGYAIRCVVDGIFLGDSVAHLIPGSALYTGTESDLVFYLLFACGFTYFLIDNYKLYKNEK